MPQANPLWPVDERFPRLEADIRKDVLVVGGGMAGISCAFHLKRAGYDVAVLEGDEVGGPATGSSSGVLYYGSGLNYRPSAALFGKGRADLMWNQTAAAIEEISSIAQREGIECGARRCGAVMVARTKAEAEEVELEHSALRALGLPSRLFSSSDLRSVYPLREFVGGISFDAVGQIHPARFAAGLARASGLELYERTPADGSRTERDSVIITTPRGKAVAREVVFATNVGPCFGLEERWGIESSVILVSEPTNRVKEAFPQEKIIWTMDEKYDLVYPRGDRLVLELYGLGDEDQKLAYYYPGLDFSTAQTYGEVWAKPPDWVPMLGKVAPHISVAVGMGDQGIIMSWLSGSKLPGILRGQEDWFTDMTSPNRFGVVTGAAGRRT